MKTQTAKDFEFTVKTNFLKKLLIIFLVLAVIGICTVLGINAHVKHVAKKYILDPDGIIAQSATDYDCAIVLGCKVKENGCPSDMLQDRLTRGIETYNSGAVPKLLMSGDHGQKGYDEVGTMKQVAIDSGIASEDVFMDHAGFSTYETMYRARDVFCVQKPVIVTQKYHLYRSIYVARKLGLDAYGVPADYHIYIGQSYREFREILARCKDFVQLIFMPKPTYLGDEIPISGSGDLTND